MERTGGAERNRTADLFIANEALYQLSYSPLGERADKGGTERLSSGLGRLDEVSCSGMANFLPASWGADRNELFSALPSTFGPQQESL